MVKNLRNLFILTCLLLMSMAVYSVPKIPKEVIFEGEVYKQGSQNGDGVKKGRYTEYFREGENRKNYEKIIAIDELLDQSDLKEFMSGNKPMINKDPEYSMTFKKDGSEAAWTYVDPYATQYIISRSMKKDGHIVSYIFIYNFYEDNDTRHAKQLKNMKQNKDKWKKELEAANYIN